MTSVNQSKNQPSKTDIMRLLADFSIELTATTVLKRTDLATLFAEKQLIYVTFLPGAEFADTLSACEKLIDLGYRVRPHIAARSLHSQTELEKGLAKIQQLDITSILLIAGAVRYPKGPFNSTLDILANYELAQFGVKEISFAGHPEGSVDILPFDVEEIERIKQDYILQHEINGSFTTQFCFDAAPVTQWLENLQTRHIQMPVNVGIPGVVSTKSLIKHAKACGVGASMNYLLRYTRTIRQLLSLNSPDRLIYDLACYQLEQNQQTLMNKLHFFPFGGLEATLQWIERIQCGEFNINKKGIKLHV